MPAGFAHAGVCFADKQAAAESFASSAFPRVSQAGECLHIQSATVSGSQVLVSSQVAPVTCAVPAAQVFTPDFPACDSLAWTSPSSPLSVADGAQLSFAIVLLWFVAFGFKAVFRALRSDEEPPTE